MKLKGIFELNKGEEKASRNGIERPAITTIRMHTVILNIGYNVKEEK